MTKINFGLKTDGTEKFTSQNKSISVLYVDDELNNLEGFRANYRRYYTIFTALSAKEAKAILSEHEIHILICDQKMPETTGTQLLEQAVQAYPQQTRILLTAYFDDKAIMGAFQKGLIFNYMFKPYKFGELKNLIDKAYEVYQLKQMKDSLFNEWLRTNESLSLLKQINSF